MIINFDRSDKDFIELIHDAEKRTAALKSFSKKRELYYIAAILNGLIAFANLFFDLKLSIVFFVSTVLLTSIHSYFDNRIKLLLYTEQVEKESNQ